MHVMHKACTPTELQSARDLYNAAAQVLDEIGRFPVIIRPAFTLGGTGGGIAYNMDEFQEIMDQGLTASVTNQACSPIANSYVLNEIGNVLVTIGPALTLGHWWRYRLQHGRVPGDHGPGPDCLRHQSGMQPDTQKLYSG